MPRRSPRALATVAAVHILLLAGVAPALAAPSGPATVGTAAPTIGEVKVRPQIVVLPASNGTKATTAFTIALRVRDADGVDTVVTGLYAPGSKKGIAVRATRTAGAAASGTWTARMRLTGTASVGTWKVQAFATDRQQRSTDPGKVYTEYEVRTPTRVKGFDVPEPVETGAPLKIVGTLQRWAGERGWVPYAGREVRLEFRPEGTKRFAVVETLTTRADGSLGATEERAQRAGTWRLSFPGQDTRAAAVSREDEVNPQAPPKEEEQGGKADAVATPSPTPRASAPDPTRPRQPAPTNSSGSAATGSGPTSR